MAAVVTGLLLSSSLPRAACADEAHAFAKGVEPPPDERRLDKVIVPVAGGDSDLGFGAGALVSFTKLVPGFKPYRWRIEGAGFFTFKKQPSHFETPYQDAAISITFPGLLERRLRLGILPYFTRSTALGYNGVGNASVETRPWLAFDPTKQADRYEAAKKLTEYSLTLAGLKLDGRFELYAPVYVSASASYQESWIGVYAGSELARDRAGDHGAHVRALVEGPAQHGVVLFEYALVIDTRDDETSPTRGVFQKFAIRQSPGGDNALPYAYNAVSMTARVYQPIWGRHVSLAGRFVGDVLFGKTPFYQLARYDEGWAVGGVDGVRGVPAQRYYGKRKVFGNFELRTEMPSFKVFSKEITLGVVGFFDAGRVWADDLSAPELDGTTLGLKYGVGGGLRLRVGKPFVLRADVAWSPDAHPVGGYFKAGQTF